MVRELPPERAAELESVLHYRELTRPNRTQQRILDGLFAQLQKAPDFRDPQVGRAFRLLVLAADGPTSMHVPLSGR